MRCSPRPTARQSDEKTAADCTGPKCDITLYAGARTHRKCIVKLGSDELTVPRRRRHRRASAATATTRLFRGERVQCHSIAAVVIFISISHSFSVFSSRFSRPSRPVPPVISRLLRSRQKLTKLSSSKYRKTHVSPSSCVSRLSHT